MKKVRNLNALERKASLMIQRIYRGHLNRKAAALWKSKVEDLQALKSLSTACAIAISRVWRGYAARKHASSCRKELAQYIISLREKEAIEDEKEYWENHVMKRWRTQNS